MDAFHQPRRLSTPLSLLFAAVLLSVCLNPSTLLVSAESLSLSHVTALLPIASTTRDGEVVSFEVSATGGANDGCAEWSVEKSWLLRITQHLNSTGCPSGTSRAVSISPVISSSADLASQSPVSKSGNTRHIAKQKGNKQTNSVLRQSSLVFAWDKSDESANCQVYLDAVSELRIGSHSQLIFRGHREEVSVLGYDSSGNLFSTLNGLSFDANIEHQRLLTVVDEIDRQKAKAAPFLKSDVIVVEALRVGRTAMQVSLSRPISSSIIPGKVQVFVVDKFSVVPSHLILPQCETAQLSLQVFGKGSHSSNLIGSATQSVISGVESPRRGKSKNNKNQKNPNSPSLLPLPNPNYSFTLEGERAAKCISVSNDGSVQSGTDLCQSVHCKTTDLICEENSQFSRVSVLPLTGIRGELVSSERLRMIEYVRRQGSKNLLEDASDYANALLTRRQSRIEMYASSLRSLSEPDSPKQRYNGGKMSSNINSNGRSNEDTWYVSRELSYLVRASVVGDGEQDLCLRRMSRHHFGSSSSESMSEAVLIAGNTVATEIQDWRKPSLFNAISVCPRMNLEFKLNRDKAIGKRSADLTLHTTHIGNERRLGVPDLGSDIGSIPGKQNQKQKQQPLAFGQHELVVTYSPQCPSKGNSRNKGVLPQHQNRQHPSIKPVSFKKLVKVVPPVRIGGDVQFEKQLLECPLHDAVVSDERDSDGYQTVDSRVVILPWMPGANDKTVARMNLTIGGGSQLGYSVRSLNTSVVTTKLHGNRHGNYQLEIAVSETLDFFDSHSMAETVIEVRDAADEDNIDLLLVKVSPIRFVEFDYLTEPTNHREMEEKSWLNLRLKLRADSAGLVRFSMIPARAAILETVFGSGGSGIIQGTFLGSISIEDYVNSNAMSEVVTAPNNEGNKQVSQKKKQSKNHKNDRKWSSDVCGAMDGWVRVRGIHQGFDRLTATVRNGRRQRGSRAAASSSSSSSSLMSVSSTILLSVYKPLRVQHKRVAVAITYSTMVQFKGGPLVWPPLSSAVAGLSLKSKSARSRIEAEEKALDLRALNTRIARETGAELDSSFAQELRDSNDASSNDAESVGSVNPLGLIDNRRVSLDVQTRMNDLDSVTSNDNHLHRNRNLPFFKYKRVTREPNTGDSESSITRLNFPTVLLRCDSMAHGILELSVSNERSISLANPAIAQALFEVWCFPALKFETQSLCSLKNGSSLATPSAKSNDKEGSKSLRLGISKSVSVQRCHLPQWLHAPSVLRNFAAAVSMRKPDSLVMTLSRRTGEDWIQGLKLGTATLMAELKTVNPGSNVDDKSRSVGVGSAVDHSTPIFVEPKGFSTTVEVLVTYRGFEIVVPSSFAALGAHSGLLAHIRGLDGEMPLTHNMDDVSVNWWVSNSRIAQIVPVLPAGPLASISDAGRGFSVRVIPTTESSSDSSSSSSLSSSSSSDSSPSPASLSIDKQLAEVELRATVQLENPPLNTQRSFTISKWLRYVSVISPMGNRVLAEPNTTVSLSSILRDPSPSARAASINGGLYTLSFSKPMNVDRNNSASDRHLSLLDSREGTLFIADDTPIVSNYIMSLSMKSNERELPSQLSAFSISVTEGHYLQMEWNTRDGHLNYQAPSVPRSKLAIPKRMRRRFSVTDNALCEGESREVRVYVTDELSRRIRGLSHGNRRVSVRSNNTGVLSATLNELSLNTDGEGTIEVTGKSEGFAVLRFATKKGLQSVVHFEVMSQPDCLSWFGLSQSSSNTLLGSSKNTRGMDSMIRGDSGDIGRLNSGRLMSEDMVNLNADNHQSYNINNQGRMKKNHDRGLPVVTPLTSLSSNSLGFVLISCIIGLVLIYQFGGMLHGYHRRPLTSDSGLSNNRSRMRRERRAVSPLRNSSMMGNLNRSGTGSMFNSSGLHTTRVDNNLSRLSHFG